MDKIFKYDKEWIDKTEVRALRRMIIETMLSIVFIASAVLNDSIFLYTVATIFVVLLVSDLYYLPKTKRLQDSHSIEVSDHGLIVRYLNIKPITLKWKNIDIHSKSQHEGELSSLTLIDNSGIGKVELKGIENMKTLENIIRERINNT